MVAQGDLLRRLFKAYSKRDDAIFRQAASDIIQEERSKNHRLLADDLERLLTNGNGASTFVSSRYQGPEIPRDKERGFQLVDIAEYRYDWERLIVSARTSRALQELVAEYSRADVLNSFGLSPTQRVLFFGPPGGGKTLAAQVLASQLFRPLVTVRFDAVVSSYLGETAANLRRVFDFVSRGSWVVLFDEFDAIGKDRDNPFEHGELKRVVNTLLQLMDAYRGNSLLIAATNHENLLDVAIWRRFESVFEFGYPTEQDRLLMLRLFLRAFDTKAIDLASIAKRTKGFTGAEIELLAVTSVKRAILDSRKNMNPEDFETCLASIQDRARQAKPKGAIGTPRRRSAPTSSVRKRTE
jgi:SpoVK/Ycf46/Vps4 family AAA+-type ATPase